MSQSIKQIRYGFIGCGMMGQEHLRNIALLPNSPVTSIFEPDDTMAARALALAPGASRAPGHGVQPNREQIQRLVY